MRQPDEQSSAERTSAGGARWDALVLAACVLLPACLAIFRVANTGDAAHDEAIVRTVGLGWTGAWRALDAPYAALFAWVPLGTRVARAAFASAVACGVSGGLLFVIARGLVRRVADAGVLGTAVAGIASLAATLSPAWQAEAMAPAGTCLGALLVLAPTAIAVTSEGGEHPSLLALTCGVALSYEPLVGLGAIALLGAVGGLALLGSLRAAWRASVAWLVVGCSPLFVGLARRVSPLGVAGAFFARSLGERGESVAVPPLAFATGELGVLSCVAVVAGVVLAWLSPRARGAALGLGAVVAIALLAMTLGAAAGPTRYGAPVLAGVGAAYALAAVAMQGVVRVVDQARVPFARASASMILVLEAALPARAADDASVRADQRQAAASGAWDDAAFGLLPAGTALLVTDAHVHAHLLADRAAGTMRADVAVVPLYDLAGHAALHELAYDPKLTSLWHDATLVGTPQEASLSSLATWRPITLPYEPSWERALARHLVPVGLFLRFEPEPRGASDRRRGLDDFTAAQGGLARLVAGDDDLKALTVALLHARLVALAATWERDVVARAVDDLRPFAPRDALAAEVVRRMAMSHGPIDVKGLPP